MGFFLLDPDTCAVLADVSSTWQVDRMPQATFAYLQVAAGLRNLINRKLVW